jgi:predicted PolB exonuclease-like 3'-5' exonuclease
MMPQLVFDIETIPDCEGLIRLNQWPHDMPHAEVAERAFAERREKTGNDFLPLYLHRVVAISCLLRNRDGLKVWTVGSPEDPESELVRRFFNGVESYTPQLISWNGKGFDAQVLHYRGMLHGIQARTYWDTGEDDKNAKWNNYQGRYQSRHLDLMDVLAMFNNRANAPLDALCKLNGFPGKLGTDGSAVWDSWQQGNVVGIRNYCETDVVNTYLLFCRFQLMRGHFTPESYAQEMTSIRNHLESLEGLHWKEFLAAWK